MSSLVAKNSTSQYTDEIRRRVIASYAVLGNQSRVAEQEGLPQKTVNQWCNSEWGLELLTAIRYENQDMMSAKYTSIIERNLNAQIERLDNGDVVGLDDDGKPLRQPIKYRDLVVGAGIAVDKVRLLNNQATSITVTDNALINISKQLAAYAVDKQPQIIEGYTIDDNTSVSG